MPDLSRAEAEPLIAMTKILRANVELKARKNHAGYLLAVLRPEDELGATLPGMTVEVETKAAMLVDACRTTATLFVLRQGVKWRVHQIEVQPAHKRSHNGKTGVLYGPHEHRGDETLALDDVALSCQTPLDELFAVFCTRSNISFDGSIYIS
ncbi:hypothetical protein WR30_26110 [Burkholderia contaminans FFH2055]|uniref:hypothetical protein n=1 Tax=Burkholderia contaminans TaxID=488447 RepID=UPI0006267AEC|nr:hypothetical protein [Burkholderia contaminans]KKL34010.1 hypothetical protein WR30_26110 [Burkholderia contaminans FFH2055]MEB4632199.1 hypothetical protein [Burkholderia contaminans]MEB4639652.1 hypothetical protein [Burkholderia contaminans]MEB4654308.1 hypothetical protein [Burkholderia contaminans]MEB4663403.1 hypothetical protein [Burkholderia contaminans]